MSQLGSYFIQFGQIGKSQIQDAIDAIRKDMVKLSEIGKKTGEAIVSAFKGAAVSVTALAAAGLAGTVEGNRMAFAWQQLARQVAGIALPVFQKMIDVLQKVTGWMRSLSGAQQDAILKWGALVTGAALFASGLAPVTGAVLAIAGAVKIVTDEIKELNDALNHGASQFFGRIFGLVGLAGAGNLTNGLVKKGLRDAGLTNPEGGHREPQLAPRAFEAITASYSRIQLSVTQNDLGRQQLNAQLKANDLLGSIAKDAKSTAVQIRGMNPGLSP